MLVNGRQYHTYVVVRKLSSKLSGDLAKSNIAAYDGFVELPVKDIDCLEQAREDPYYEEVVAPDEEKFFDTQRC